MNVSNSEQARRFFPPTVDPLRYFPSESQEEARTVLERVVRRGEGPAVIIGGAGLGKSMICRRIAYELRSTHRVVVLDAIRCCDRRELFQYLLRELRCAYRGLDEAELRLGLLEELGRSAAGSGLVVILDEAHLLPLDLLEDLRLLLNLEQGGRTSLHLILSGSGTLEEHLGNPRLESLSQRLAARCYLQPLLRDEIAPYLGHHLSSAHLSVDTVFDRDAIDAIYRAGDGVPRLINQLADHALVLQHSEGRFVLPLTADAVQQAWADLQQLPNPWNLAPEPRRTEESAFEVELGPLDDEPFDPAASSADDDAERDAPHVLYTESVDERSEEPRIVKFDPPTLDDPSDAPETLSAPPADTAPQAAADPFDEPFEDQMEVGGTSMRILADGDPSTAPEPKPLAEESAPSAAASGAPATMDDLYLVIDVAHDAAQPAGVPLRKIDRPLIGPEDIIIETW